MPNFIDRRLNPKDKSLGNRRRFMRRAHEELKRVVKERIRSGRIADIDAEQGVPMPARGTDEPTFQPSRSSGQRQYILPGNKEFTPGDRIAKPAEELAEPARAPAAALRKTSSSSFSRARRCSTSSSRTWSCPT
jgi:uncharacterized sporulation protein YeaH/YhbH (DUF444 family)